MSGMKSAAVPLRARIIHRNERCVNKKLHHVRIRGIQATVTTNRTTCSLHRASHLNHDTGVRNHGVPKKRDASITVRRNTRIYSSATGLDEQEGDAIVYEAKKPGKVVNVDGDLVVTSGLNPDVRLGSWVRFSGGAGGILLWRREPVTFCILQSPGAVEAGESAEEDAQRGAAAVAVNQAIWGAVVGPMGCLTSAPSRHLASADLVKLINEPPDVPARFPISSNLRMGLTAADALTPVGRGQSMMIESVSPEARSAVAVNAVLAQADVRCVYASVGRAGADSAASAENLRALQASNGSNPACIIAAPSTSSVAERYVAACMANSVAESVRAQGGDALVVVDDLSVLADFWDKMSVLFHGYMDGEWKQEGEAMMQAWREQHPQEPVLEVERPKAAKAAAGSPEELVDFGGTLVPVEIAERRSFFSNFLQRAARLNQESGGGSSTILGVCGGRPATSLHYGSGAEAVGDGDGASPEAVVAAYTTLSDDQKAKLLAALKKKQLSEPAARPSLADPSSVPTAIVEEFNSISDGHMCLEPLADNKVRLRAGESISRVGAPAAAPAMRRLQTMDLRLQLLQSEDEVSFSTSSASALSQKLASRSATIQALLDTAVDSPLALSEQVVGLFAVMRGNYLADVDASAAPARVAKMLEYLHEKHPSILADIDALGDLDTPLQDRLQAALDQFVA